MHLPHFVTAAILLTSSLFSNENLQCVSSLFSSETLHYVSNTAGKKITTVWTIEENGSKLHITAKSSDDSISILETTKDYTLENFSQKDPKKGYDFSASQKGALLTATGKIGQDTKTKSYTIDTPWIQEFTFAFKDFLKSNKSEYKFEILRPEDLEMHDMIAIKENIEELKIDDTLYTTQKMKITLQGFKRRFWKAEVWYDTATHKMLRYKANSGPGTPITETVFVKKS